MTKNPMRIVVDADISRAAGLSVLMESTSYTCREFLDQFMKLGHRLAMSPALEKEWNKHQSRYSSRWRVEMRSRKQLVLGKPPKASWKAAYLKRAVSKEQRGQWAKDCHLVEAAQYFDYRIASMDERARRAFASAVYDFAELGAIAWVNPSKVAENTIVWMRKGAKLEKHRLLKFFSQAIHTGQP